MTDRKTIVSHSAVSVRAADSLGLTLGEMRRFVAEADALGIPDTEYLSFEGIGQSYTRVDERYAKVVNVYWQRVTGDDPA